MTIDNGGTNTKVTITDLKGHQSAVVSFPTKRIETTQGFQEISLTHFFDDIADAIRKALKKSGLNGKQIAGIATVGHGKGLYALNKERKIFMNGILSADERGKNLAAHFERQVNKIFPITRQHVVSSQVPVLLRWLKENEPRKYEALGVVLSNKDFIRFLLTGECTQEISDASGNNLLNLVTKKYDKNLLDFFGINDLDDVFPRLIKSTDIAGRVTSKVAKSTGLQEGTPVVGGMFDIDACALATGVLKDDEYSIVAGTWNINTFPSKQPATLKSGLMSSIYPTGDFLLEASSPTSAGNLQMMLDMLMVDEQKNAQANNTSIYEYLEDFLRTTDSTFTKTIFFPFLYGTNAQKDAQASFIGINSMSTKSSLIRAVYEGIIFAHKVHVEQLCKCQGKTPHVIRMSGGACNSPSWTQMFADVLAIPIETVTAKELGGVGGAMAAAIGLGYYSSFEEASQLMVRVKNRFVPDMKEKQRYSEKYDVYRKFSRAMDCVWPYYGQVLEG